MRLRNFGRISLPASSLASAVGGLVTILGISKILPSHEFAHFSLLLSAAQLSCVIAFEWLRLSVLRFWREGSRTRRAPSLQAAITWMYLGELVVASAVVVVAILLGWVAVALVVAIAGTTAMLDWRQTCARSAYDDFGFVQTSLLRAVVLPMGTLVAASWAPDALWALGGYLGSQILALVPSIAIGGRARARIATGTITKGDLAEIASYGSAMSLGGAVSAGIFTLARSVSISLAGAAGSFPVLIAIDVGQRAFFSVGAAASLMTFPDLVRSHTSGAKVAFAVAAKSHFLLLWGTFFALLTAGIVAGGLGARYLGVQLDDPYSTLVATAACGLLAFRNFAVDAIFVVRADRLAVLIGPILSLTSFGAFAVASTYAGIWKGEVGTALLASAALGTFVAAAWASVRLETVAWVPWRAVALSLILLLGCARVAGLFASGGATLFP